MLGPERAKKLSIGVHALRKTEKIDSLWTGRGIFEGRERESEKAEK
jgi:hypothetical protein